MPYHLRGLSIRKVSVVPKGANPDAHIVLFKSEEPVPPTVPAQEEPHAGGITKEHTMQIDRTKLTKEEGEYLDALEAKVAAIAAEPPPPPAPPPADDDVMKALPETVRKMLDDQRAEIVKATERAMAAEAAARVEKEARDRAEVIKMAETDLSSLVGTAVEKGTLLYAVRNTVTKEQYDALVTLLKAANAAARAVTVPSGTDDTGTMSTAYQKMETLAKDLVAKGTTTTMALALDLVAQQNPELWREYRQETRRGSIQ